MTLAGTAGATTAVVSGSGTTYDVAVSGMTSDGTVIASLLAGVAHDAATNASAASTSTDNTVTYDNNDAPTAVDDTFTATEDTDLVRPASGIGSPAFNDTDPDGDTLTVTIVGSATGGPSPWPRARSPSARPPTCAVWVRAASATPCPTARSRTPAS